MMDDAIKATILIVAEHKAARRAFAEELRHTAHSDEVGR